MTEIIKVAIYVLCVATSAACAFLLVRGYLQHRARLLLWSGICFVFLAINSTVVILDILVFPELDLLQYRHMASFMAVGVLLVGLVWETT